MAPRLLNLWAGIAALLLVSLGCQQYRGPSLISWNPLGMKPQARKAAPQSAAVARLDARQTTDMQMDIARSLEHKGQTDEAIKAYLEVLKKDERRIEASHRLAVLYCTKGDFKSANEHYRAALRKSPNNAQLQCDYGYSCYLQKQWQPAEAGFRTALKIEPQLSRAHNNLGMLLARTGRTDEALREFARAGCSRAESHANLAFAMASDEHYPEARRQFELALAADPSLDRAKQGLASLDSVAAFGAKNAAASHESPVPVASFEQISRGPGAPGNAAGAADPRADGTVQADFVASKPARLLR